MSADAESQVTDLIWGDEERELLTSHGYSRNHLAVWKYPSLVKVADIEGHSDRVVGLAKSPDGSLVVSASADETLRFWRVFSRTPGEKNAKSEVRPSNHILKTIR